MKVVLVSGFEPFGGERVNPAAEIARSLDGETVGGSSVRSAILPVTWAGAAERLIAAVREAAAAADVKAVVMLGQAGGYPAVGLERVAVNVCNGKDNAGVERAEVPVVSGGPASYFSTLPLSSILARIESLGLPAFISNTAGTYLCNFVFYSLMHHLASWPDGPGRPSPGAVPGPPPAGFIHVPYLPEQAVGKKPIPPSMARSDIERAIRAALEAAVGTGTN